MRLIGITAVIAAAICFTATSADARVGAQSKQQQIHALLKTYYHADGFIKSIGRVAYRTIYSSDAAKRSAWKAKARHLIVVRADAKAAIDALRAPPLPPHYAQWLCIHRFEGSWTDSGAPFWGGLQMDYGFQETYGGDLLKTKGTADHWTPLEQMWVAEKAYASRGFHPWPNTARYCGLL